MIKLPLSLSLLTLRPTFVMTVSGTLAVLARAFGLTAHVSRPIGCALVPMSLPSALPAMCPSTAFTPCSSAPVLLLLALVCKLLLPNLYLYHYLLTLPSLSSLPPHYSSSIASLFSDSDTSKVPCVD